MASAHRSPLLRAASLFALTAASCHALQLGENEAQITARHGAPAVEDHARHLAVYYWDGWSAQLEFQQGVVGKLTYRRYDYLAEAELQSLLQANGGAARWREAAHAGRIARRWVRDDGAVATSDAARPTSLVFETATAAAKTAPVETMVADSFLKFDAPAKAVPLRPVSAPPSGEPVVRANDPRPQLRSEPQLREPADFPEISVPEPPAAPLPAAENESPTESPAAAAPPLAAAKPSPTQNRQPAHGVGSAALGILAAVGLLGAVAFHFLRKSKRPAPAASAPRAMPTPGDPVPPPAPVAVARPGQDLSSLRSDQVELALGEIFRRQGYTVEMSAALGTDGTSDLTLRRDGESIPVQSKDWQAERVGEREVREFYAVMAAAAAPRGILVTTGSFSRDARTLAAEKAIELIDRAGLEQRIAAVRRPEENFFDVHGWIEDFAASARIFDPECPCCGQAMSIRRHRLDGTSAWTCATYPRCAGKRETRRDLLTLPVAA